MIEALCSIASSAAAGWEVCSGLQVVHVDGIAAVGAWFERLSTGVFTLRRQD